MLSPEQKKGRGDFFAIPARNVARVCGLGMNPAVAYLVLARGTGRDNVTTSWSVQAIEKYTGIARSRAAQAVKVLRDSKIVTQTKGGTQPQYKLVGGKKSEPLVWLPNAFVTGAVSETPPLELIRQTQDVMTLRLALDLYGSQNLREDGGISRHIVITSYNRTQVGQCGEYVIWGFERDLQVVSWTDITIPHRREKLSATEKKQGKNAGVDFFRRVAELVGCGAIEWIPYLVESGKDDSEVIHPCGHGNSESIEDRLGRAAEEAANGMVTEGRREYARNNGLTLTPVKAHIANVQMVGVARLRYRPRTAMTGAWWANLNVKADKYLAEYARLCERVKAA